ncbi:hypothetical protein [Hymenobacter rigui]|uniref:Uncharacterized protein n=1 Tax=Hymenobacter rigui TaxID=334424 RepID=A0A3R9P639_9BACT|nr:hypothetical protein [Hymenobacter rigui]RSK49542.1 hypothetical protein EI291_08610 [Hymenobacter rigui]
MKTIFLAFFAVPLLSTTEASATSPVNLHTTTVAAAGKTGAAELPGWFKRKKRHHTPAYRRLRARR